jgi:hypothetical protein
MRSPMPVTILMKLRAFAASTLIALGAGLGLTAPSEAEISPGRRQGGPGQLGKSVTQGVVRPTPMPASARRGKELFDQLLNYT